MTDSLYGGRKPQLLAVDDDDMNLMMISRAFKNEADAKAYADALNSDNS